MRWTYLSAVASRGEYGERAVEQLQDIMRNSTFEDICFATVELLPRSPLEKDYDSLIEKLLNHEKSRAVIVFLNEDKLRQMLAAADRRNVRGHFLWIGSDSWGAKFQPVQNIERAAEGAITILPKRFPIPGFDEYFLSLKPDTNRRNPWFKEYWESQFNCVFGKNNTSARLTGGRIVKKSCTGEEDLQPSFRQEGLVAMVVDSVYVIAHALRNLCIDNPKMCKDWDKKPDGKLLREYVANVTFNSSQAHAMTIKFDSERSIPINYTIYQFRKIDEPDREYDYIPIGEWNLERRLVLWEEPRWRKESQTNDYDSFRIESSACSSPCEPGEERVRMHHRRCCWTCRPCDGDYYLPHQYAHCTPCPTGYVPNDDRMSCKWLRAEYMGSDWGSPWALVPSLFSCLGILCTIIAIAVFILYRKTPVIKASGRELCYVIFAGVLLCYCFTFIVVTEPTEARCGMLRVGLGLGLSVCYSAIFTKTNRISRIFNRRLSTTKRPAYISPRSQLVIVLCLVSIQLTLSVMWIIVSPPTVKTYTLESPRAYLITCGIDSTSVLLGLLYNMLLVILCTVYAYKTRNIPENFNEAKYISFTMYSSCIVWLAFVAIYSSTWKDFKVQSTILCMSVSMSGTVVLLCLFFPKLYLVLLKPHKNVRYPNSTTHSASAMDTMMPVRYVRSGVSPSNTLAPPQPCATSSCNSYNLSTSPDLKILNSSTE